MLRNSLLVALALLTAACVPTPPRNHPQHRRHCKRQNLRMPRKRRSDQHGCRRLKISPSAPMEMWPALQSPRL